MAEDTAAQPQADGTQGGPQFAIRRIYIKDLSFESPLGIDAFAAQNQPKIAQDLNTQVSKIDDDHFEVVLKLTVTVKREDDKTLFLVEVHQAGVFNISGVAGEQLQHLLTATCPGILFPYARETIDNVAVRGGFPPLSIPPINFEAVLAQAKAKAQQQATDGAH
ncbi:protein-export chaperone SecB [Teredinibacter waterburyi]|jgi:protein translocase subunit secB|uniref:protein-export chaperone SecB n=1 Tax=Teredinibacter waterburyi TaxID=1500538 RepID=UPI00165EFA61|nr:protein-export chaperone SecB [Teredinibacter waterburyi]